MSEIIEAETDIDVLLYELKEAGASLEYRACVREADDDSRLIEQSIRDLKRDVAWRGDFRMALWDGDIARAWIHADNVNRRLLGRTFSEPYLKEALSDELNWQEQSITREIEEYTP